MRSSLVLLGSLVKEPHLRGLAGEADKLYSELGRHEHGMCFLLFREILKLLEKRREDAFPLFSFFKIVKSVTPHYLFTGFIMVL